MNNIEDLIIEADCVTIQLCAANATKGNIAKARKMREKLQNARKESYASNWSKETYQRVQSLRDELWGYEKDMSDSLD